MIEISSKVVILGIVYREWCMVGIITYKVANETLGQNN